MKSIILVSMNCVKNDQRTEDEAMKTCRRIEVQALECRKVIEE